MLALLLTLGVIFYSAAAIKRDGQFLVRGYRL